MHEYFKFPYHRREIFAGWRRNIYRNARKSVRMQARRELRPNADWERDDAGLAPRVLV